MVQALICLIRTTNPGELCLVKSTKKPHTVPAGETVHLPCRANTGPIHRKTPVIFEPDELATWPSGLIVHESLTTVKEGGANIFSVPLANNTNHDITLPGRVVLGRLHLVRSVTPVEVRFKDPETQTPCEESPCKQYTPAEQIERNLSWLPEVDLSGLSAEQKEQAKQLLVEKADAFATSDDDVGCISELEMDIRYQYRRSTFPYPAHSIPKLKVTLRTCLTVVSFGSPDLHSQVVLSGFVKKMVG